MLQKLLAIFKQTEPPVDEFAYERGYADAEKGRTDNPYHVGSVLYSSWKKGYKAREDYEMYVW